MSAVSKHSANDTLLNKLQQRLQDANISSTTLIFTFFCDVVTRHGGEIWLGHVIQTLAPLGINERSVRTAVFRLVKDGWLISRKHGRCSYYQLSQTGEHSYHRAAKRIYTSQRVDWGGVWMLVFVSLVADEKREALQRGLLWLGYGRLATGVYALPGNRRGPLEELLADLDIQENIVHMQAQADNSDSLKELVLSRWQLDELTHRYSEFIEWYERSEEQSHELLSIDPHILLLLRIVLIHEYRRIRLTDPELPGDMLPPNSPGDTAQAMTARLYRRLYSPTSKWFRNELLADDNISVDKAIAIEDRFPE